MIAFVSHKYCKKVTFKAAISDRIFEAKSWLANKNSQTYESIDAKISKSRFNMPIAAEGVRWSCLMNKFQREKGKSRCCDSRKIVNYVLWS